MNTLTERLALIIDGHSDGAVSAVQRLSVEEKVAAERAEILEVKIAALNTRIAKSANGATGTQRLQLSKMNTEYKALTSNLANVPGFASKAEKALGKVGLGGIVPSSTLRAAGKALPGLIGGAAVFGAFEFLKHGVEAYENLATQIRGVQQAASSSAPDASKLVAITNALGIDASSAALGLFRLGKNIELTPQKLSAYDIAVARTKTGNVDLIGTLENVAARYQQTVDPAKRAAIVYEAFGRAGATMLPILNANKETIKGIVDEAAKSGRIFTDSDIKKARDLQIAGREMKDSFDGLAISAGKTLVPALSAVAHGLTDIIDAGNWVASHLGIGKGLSAGIDAVRAEALKRAKSDAERTKLNALFDRTFGQSPEQKAADELASEQEQAARQALANSALATLAGGYDVLAGPEKIKAAKAALVSAKTALEQAVASRTAAAVALAKAKVGAPAASALAIEAATARVIAAQANLRKAEYVGGDARVASARATLLSSQVTLNRLRAEGGVKTEALAAAETRLHLAQEKVAAAQGKVKTAQKGVNDATGLSAGAVLARLTGQAKDQTGLAAANLKLAASGLSAEAIAGIDKLEQQIPGTLVKVARGINAGIVAQMNAQESALETAQQEFADAASNPALFTTAGTKAGNAYVAGFSAALSNAHLALAKPGRVGLHTVRDGGPAPTGVVLNVGTVKVDSRTGAQLAADLAKHVRLGRLSGGLARASAA